MSEPIYREFKKPNNKEQKHKDRTLREEYEAYMEEHKRPWYLQ